MPARVKRISQYIVYKYFLYCKARNFKTFFLFTGKPTDENITSPFEEAILRELVQTKPTKELHMKSDKIESFTKYMETCLREMASDVSKRVMNKIL